MIDALINQRSQLPSVLNRLNVKCTYHNIDYNNNNHNWKANIVHYIGGLLLIDFVDVEN